MTNKRNRILLAIIGFFVFIAPIIFLFYSLKKEYQNEKERLQEALKEKLINSSYKFDKELDCYLYLKSEFKKIHAELIPEFPEDITEKIPEDSITRNLYNKELLNKLIDKTVNRFSPIMINLGTENFKELYGYFSPKLEKDLQNETNKNELLDAKSFFDIEKGVKDYYYFFNKELDLTTPNKFFELKEQNIGYSQYYLMLYRYISRFSEYRKENTLYTDYFSKQSLFSISKFTMSPKGIHGFYSLLIPQSRINPDSVYDFAISQHDSEVKISLGENTKTYEINQTSKGFEYPINFSSKFKNHVNTFKRLTGIDKSSKINKQIIFSIDYPQEYIYLELINTSLNNLTFLSIILYLLFILILKNYYKKTNIDLTKKLVCILSIIMLTPTIGLGIFSLITFQKLDNLIDINASKDLHNSLENYFLLDNEIMARRFSSVLEMKKRISKADLEKFNNNSIIDLFEPHESEKWNNISRWIFLFNSDLFFTKENGKGYSLDVYTGEELQSNKKLIKLIKLALAKYLKNLGLSTNRGEKKDEIFALSLLDQYINPRLEEKSVSQESIQSKDFITFAPYDSSIFFYAKDINNKNYYFYSKTNRNSRRFRILNSFNAQNPLWHQPKYKYGYDTDIAITISTNNSSRSNSRLQIPPSNSNSKTNKLLNKALENSDSGYEKILSPQGTTIYEYIYSEETPFVIAGTTKSNYNSGMIFTAKLIIPFLVIYSLLLLFFLSKLISTFIENPIKIYKEAIEKLSNNHFGTTIESFSNDEFNYITNAFNKMSVAIKQKEQMKRYVSDRLIKSLENNEVQKAGIGKLERVTILSSDIRNFTGISENYEPSIIVEMLNSYFTKMQQAISENGGIIDKYIGDAIQAVFYDEPEKDNQVIQAAKASIAMRKALAEYNKERIKNGLFTIENGIGIDTDYAITGTIGMSEGRKDFSVNGDVVARAADLESKTKRTTSKILLSKASLEAITPFKKGGCQATPDRGIFNNNAKPESIAKGKNSLSANADFSPYEGESLITHYQSLTTNHKSQLIFKDFDEEAVELLDVKE